MNRARRVKLYRQLGRLLTAWYVLFSTHAAVLALDWLAPPALEAQTRRGEPACGPCGCPSDRQRDGRCCCAKENRRSDARSRSVAGHGCGSNRSA
ncbi:MAG: hypothetical protein ACOC46_00810, partial [Pirellulales bacterium]